MKRLFPLWIFAGCMLYALLRYQICKEISWERAPVWTSNKALSMAGLILLSIALVGRYFKASPQTLKYAGRSAYFMLAAHSIISLALLLLKSDSHGFFYSKCTAKDAGWMLLTPTGLGVLASGVSGIALLSWIHFGLHNSANCPAHAKLRLLLGLFTIVISLVHLALLGMPGWLALSKWPSHLPPITLLSALVALITVILLAYRATASVQNS